MRSPAALLLASLTLAACAPDAAPPSATEPAAAAAARGAPSALPDGKTPGTPIAPTRCDPSKAPALTDAQKAQITALTTAFTTANKADLDAVAAAGRQAEAAKRAGQSAAEIQKLLDAVKPAAERLAAAQRELDAKIQALLTPEQKASGCKYPVAVGTVEPTKRPPVAPPAPPVQAPKGTATAPLPPVALLVQRLPESLKLTADQQTKLKALTDAYAKAVQPDVEALRVILDKAGVAAKAGASRADVAKILEAAAPVEARLAAAQQALETQITALLTADQRAWLAANTPKRCDPSKAVPLTDAQRTQIAALTAAFTTANKADLDAIAAAGRQAEAAKRAGQSAAEIQKILDAVKPAADRVAKARAELDAKIAALLTAEQKASGCTVVLVSPKG